MQEKRAILLLLGLAVAGHGVRLLLRPSSEPPGQLLGAAHRDSDPLRHRARAIELARPLPPGETVDLNAASAEEIARLPRVGMSLAKRIVGFRTAHGPYQSMADLDRVSGVGPALLSQLQDRIRFGGVSRRDPGSRDEAITGRGSSSYAASPEPVDLNAATETELRALPGIGPVRARAILAYRRGKGPFAAVSDLRAVPGFGQSLVRRLIPLVTVR